MISLGTGNDNVTFQVLLSPEPQSTEQATQTRSTSLQVLPQLSLVQQSVIPLKSVSALAAIWPLSTETSVPLPSMAVPLMTLLTSLMLWSTEPVPGW